MNGKNGSSWIPHAATITDLHKLSDDTVFFQIRLDDGDITSAFSAVPGQFVQLSVPAGGEAPISLAGVYAGNGILDLCVRRAGHVTGMLHSLTIGAKVGIRGPFGNGFPVGEWHGRNIILLAGGLGIAPLRALLRYILVHRDLYGDVTLMYGAREPAAILFKEELAELSGRNDMHVFLTVDFATEEPSHGLVCNTGLLPSLLSGVSLKADNTVAAVCGPPALYRCITRELLDFGFPPDAIHLSLERRMKCGNGLCCHCAVGDLFCCTDGPVFSYEKIQKIEGAI